MKEAEKVIKSKDLEIEITCKMWEVKTSAVPVVVRTLELIKKGLEKYITQIPSNIKVNSLQDISK